MHDRVINIAGLARDVGVARTTVEGYVSILEVTLIGFACRDTSRACVSASASTLSSTCSILDLTARRALTCTAAPGSLPSKETPMMKPLCSALAAVTLLAATAPTFAEGSGEHGGQDAKARIARRVDTVFARLDADKDGRISRAEAAKGPRLSRHFDKIDADHDGYVSRAELSASIERHMQR